MIFHHSHRQSGRYIAAAVLIVFSLLACLMFPFHQNTLVVTRKSPAHSLTPCESAANSTLGFHSILALSRGPSWRTSGLKAAANLTNLDISIPSQPYIYPDVVDFFQKNGASASVTQPKHGSTIAWLAHLDLLKHVVMAGFYTALIMEDDVDWDVRIATQMQRISDSIRMLLKVPETDSTPYGTDWDVIWIGHCGERAESPEYLDYPDDTRVSTEGFHGFSKKLWMDQIPEGHRRIQSAVLPICSFSYAVTAASAQKILQILGNGKDEAYDVGLQHQCSSGRLRCFTIVPQVMQHYEPPEGIGYVSNVNEESGGGQSVSDDVIEKAVGMTSNIVQSARCKAVFDSTCLSPGTHPDYWGY